jgi:hypothetical protein
VTPGPRRTYCSGMRNRRVVTPARVAILASIAPAVVIVRRSSTSLSASRRRPAGVSDLAALPGVPADTLLGARSRRRPAALRAKLAGRSARRPLRPEMIVKPVLAGLSDRLSLLARRQAVRGQAGRPPPLLASHRGSRSGSPPMVTASPSAGSRAGVASSRQPGNMCREQARVTCSRRHRHRHGARPYPAFPTPVATFRRGRIWLRSDVEALMNDAAIPLRPLNALQVARTW